MSSAVYRSRKGPRVDSWAYLALRRLHRDGGEVSLTAWMSSISYRMQLWRFRQDVVDDLVGYGFVEQCSHRVKLTKAGLEFLGEQTVPAAPTSEAMVRGRYVPPMRPLSPKHRPGPCVVRPGAFDYRDIPSRHGDTLVPYKSSVNIDSAPTEKATA